MISNGLISLLPPKPPPTSGLMTRTCDIGRPSTVGGFFIDSNKAGDVVADVANFTCGERGLIVPDGKNAVRCRTVVAGNDRNNSVQSLSLAAIDAKDASVRVRGMKNPADEHTRN